NHRAYGLIIIMIVGALLFFLPAAVIAGVVWFLTGKELYAAIAFLVVAMLSLTRKKQRIIRTHLL
ncbi:MAG: hypothetical protein NTY03_18155, partial [Candidatus Bathyarchaeota archaeon]|nr:hypothetical protein [Candidatus Bathyarchaeota archaeon]